MRYTADNNPRPIPIKPYKNFLLVRSMLLLGYLMIFGCMLIPYVILLMLFAKDFDTIRRCKVHTVRKFVLEIWHSVVLFLSVHLWMIDSGHMMIQIDHDYRFLFLNQIFK